jgi:hypothetical protein
MPTSHLEFIKYIIGASSCEKFMGILESKMVEFSFNEQKNQSSKVGTSDVKPCVAW